MYTSCIMCGIEFMAMNVILYIFSIYEDNLYLIMRVNVNCD